MPSTINNLFSKKHKTIVDALRQLTFSIKKGFKESKPPQLSPLI